MLRDTSGQDKVIVRSKKPKFWALGIAVAGVVLLGLVLVPKYQSLFASDMTVSAEALRYALVERGDLQRDIVVQGKVVAANSPTLYANSAGIVSLKIKAGDTVSKGQTLASVSSPQLNNRLAQETATLEKLKLEVGRQKIQIKSARLNNQQAIEIAQVNFDSARVNKHRAEVSLKASLIAQREYEEKIAEYKRASLEHKHAQQNYEIQQESMELELQGKQSELERQQFVVDDLRRQIQELTLTAPSDGIIGSVNVREKDNVAANAALITVIDLSALEIEAQIPESYADDLGVGLAAEVNLNGQLKSGEVVAISPEVQNGQVVGRIRFEQADIANLRQNQRVSARILIESRTDVLKLRRGAFIESGGGRLVYVVQQDRAIKRDIHLGVRGVGEVEVLSGLAEGERVIISSTENFNEQQQIYLTQ